MVERSEGWAHILAEVHQDLAAALDNIDRLAEKLPTKASDQRRVKALEERLTDIRESRAAALQVLTRDPSMNSVWEFGTLLANTEKLSSEIRSLSVDVLRVAHATKDRRETFYSASIWASYVLYAVGWGLGLLGRMFGAEPIDGAE